MSVGCVCGPVSITEQPAKIKVPLYANYDEMLEVEKPDSVVAATSNQMHTPAGIACGNLGTHILMESPYLKLWKWVRS